MWLEALEEVGACSAGVSGQVGGAIGAAATDLDGTEAWLGGWCR